MSESERAEIKTHVSPRVVDPSLLEVRQRMKARMPEFQRQESWRYVRIHEPWRKPKGVDSHMRLSIKGWPRLVKIGYRTPRATRGLHPSGFKDVLVHNMSELEALNKGTDAARLSATLGKKKRVEIAVRAKELGIRVLNARSLLEKVQPIEEKKEEGETKPAKKKSKKKARESPKAKSKRKKKQSSKKQPKNKSKKREK